MINNWRTRKTQLLCLKFHVYHMYVLVFFLIFDLFSSVYFSSAEKCSNFQKSICFTMFFSFSFYTRWCILMLFLEVHNMYMFRSIIHYKKLLLLLVGSATLWPEMSNFVQNRCYIFFSFLFKSLMYDLVWRSFWVTNDKNNPN